MIRAWDIIFFLSFSLIIYVTDIIYVLCVNTTLMTAPDIAAHMCTVQVLGMKRTRCMIFIIIPLKETYMSQDYPVFFFEEIN